MLPAEARARQAALVLHGLPVPQRAQVLDRLDKAQRGLLEPLLQELTLLGIPAVAQLRDEGRPSMLGEAVRTQVGGLDPRVAAMMLGQCSVVTIDALLDLQDQAWQQAVLARLGSEVRARITHHRLTAHPALSPRVLDCLCARLLEHAHGLRAPRRPSEAGFLSRIGTWFRWTQ